MTTFEVTAAQADESRELRRAIAALIPDAQLERFDPTCFNASVETREAIEALEEFLDGCDDKSGLKHWRLV